MRKICFITGSRAEYGLLSPLMRLVADDPHCRLQVIATNMHLLEEYGSTYREIINDGFEIDCMVPMPRPSDDAHGVVASMACEMSGMNDALRDLAPDLVVILGDRYEMLVAASVAMLHRIPIAHIHGGEITEGAYDDSIRHCITKMGSLHFASTEAYRQRIIQLGEDPQRVFCTGAIGVENIKRIPLMSRRELEASLGYALPDNLVLATYHPVTLGGQSARWQIDQLLAALDRHEELQVVFTLPNSDEGASLIRSRIMEYCDSSAGRCRFNASLGLRRYLSMMQFAKAVIGNSSSGIIEVPSAHIPTLNIGDRQKGRVHGPSVVDCAPDADSIDAGLRTVLSAPMQQIALSAPNPYEKEGTAARIAHVITTHPLDGLVNKRFYDLP